MMNIFYSRPAKQTVHWLLLALLALYVVTGLGITEYRIIELISFGILNKTVAFIIHNNLLIPLVVLLVLHIVQGFGKKKVED